MPETKHCVHCHAVKLRDDFYRSRKKSDGLQPWCKDCLRARKRNPEPVRRHTAKWVAENREKKRAQLKVMKALQYGRIQRPTICEECGEPQEESLHGHHDDYSKPLDVRWLCRLCHVAEHREEARA